MLFGSDRGTHEINCMFSWQRCPTSHLGCCTWIGPEKDAFQHCKETHREFAICEGSIILCEWKNNTRFSVNDDCLDLLIYAFDKTFHCNIAPNKEIIEAFLRAHKEGDLHFNLVPKFGELVNLQLFDGKSDIASTCFDDVEFKVTPQISFTIHLTDPSKSGLVDYTVSCSIHVNSLG